MYDTYIEIRSVGGINGSPHPLGQFRLAASVVDGVHFENARRTKSGTRLLAVAFPDLVPEGRDTMARVRVFGGSEDAEDLQALLTSLSADERSSAFQASAPQAVPERHGLIAYVRDRSADREFNGYSERALSRAQRKAMERLALGEAVNKVPMDSVTRGARLAERQIASIGVTRAHLRLRSRSNGNGFAIFVAPVTGANGSPEATLDIYGLSTRSSATALPSF